LSSIRSSFEVVFLEILLSAPKPNRSQIARKIPEFLRADRPRMGERKGDITGGGKVTSLIFIITYIHIG
jgi:hypothetical protein